MAEELPAHRPGALTRPSVIFVAAALACVTGFIGARAIVDGSGGGGGEVVRVAAAGDIACEPAKEQAEQQAQTGRRCAARAVSDAILHWSPDVVLPLGDLQYQKGSLADFRASYDRTWGRLKHITRPVVGNHEYLTPDAAGYFDYFGSAAGAPDKGYYSFAAGSWQVLVLNTNCRWVGGCDEGSPQLTWLTNELEARKAKCTLVAAHHPRFSSGTHGNDERYSAIWDVLRASGVDVVLTGHDHTYERFAPQDAQGNADAGGPRSFVVGTGGANHTQIRSPVANSEVHNDDVFGFLGLELGGGHYRWRFHGVDASQVIDEGRGECS